MIDFFEFNKECKIAIYGSGVGGISLYKELLQNEYEVLYFIDQIGRPGLKIEGKDVINLNDLKMQTSKDIVIFISLQNALIHEEIAAQLFALGYDRLLYYPSSNSYEYMKIMREIYINIQCKDFSRIIRVPKYLARNDNIILENSMHVALWVNVEIVRFKTKEMLSRPLAVANRLKAAQKKWNKYAGKPLIEIKPYIELFRYLEGSGNYPEEYLDLMRPGATEEEKEALLNDREKMYLIYERSRKYDPDMLIFAPIQVEYSENCLYVIDGMHRAIYLYLQGYEMIPVIMYKNDYDHYLTG